MNTPFKEEAEFDDIMRSGSTMKVSLTPDRLKTMEVSSPYMPSFSKVSEHCL